MECLVDSIEFLNFSKKIMGLNPIEEIDYRQVVGRSYYCAFHQLKEKAKTLGIPVDAYAGGTHSTVVTTIASHKPRNSALIGLAYKVNAFHSIRVLADYKLEIPVTEVMANEAIKKCEEILKEISKISSL